MVYLTKLNKRYAIDYEFDNIDEYNLILNSMTKVYEEYEFWNKKYKTKKYTYIEKITNSILRSDYGFIDIILNLMKKFNIEYKFTNEIFPSNSITILDKWISILNNNEYSINGYTQYQYLYQLLNYNIGIGKYFTGFGKTELQLAIIESFSKQYPDKNILIILPSSLIIENFINRANQYKVKTLNKNTNTLIEISNYIDIENNISVINPNGFMRSKNKDNIDY